MENTNKPSLIQTTLTWGLITGFAGVVYSLILYFAGLSLNKPAGYAGMIITIAGIYLGIKAFRDQSLGGYISYGRALGTGVLISLFASIIGTIFMIILYTYIDPELITRSLQESQDKMAERGMAEDQIEAAMEMSKKLFVPMVGIMGILMGVFLGFIISLIVSIFVKKEGDAFNKDMASVK